MSFNHSGNALLLNTPLLYGILKTRFDSHYVEMAELVAINIPEKQLAFNLVERAPREHGVLYSIITHRGYLEQCETPPQLPPTRPLKPISSPSSNSSG